MTEKCVLSALLLTREAMPLTLRGDIVALRERFSKKHLRKWLLAYLLREPQLVSAFFEDGWEGVMAAPKAYRYMPRRLVGKLNASRLRGLSKAKLRAVEREMHGVLEDPRSQTAIGKLEAAMRRLPGVGDYVCKHFTRTLLLMIDAPHPSGDFIVMGAGASKGRYRHLLHRHGIHDVGMLNDALERHLGTVVAHRIDAAELAYLMCMSNFPACT